MIEKLHSPTQHQNMKLYGTTSSTIYNALQPTFRLLYIYIYIYVLTYKPSFYIISYQNDYDFYSIRNDYFSAASPIFSFHLTVVGVPPQKMIAIPIVKCAFWFAPCFFFSLVCLNFSMSHPILQMIFWKEIIRIYRTIWISRIEKSESRRKLVLNRYGCKIDPKEYCGSVTSSNEKLNPLRNALYWCDIIYFNWMCKMCWGVCDFVGLSFMYKMHTNHKTNWF